VDVRKVKPEDIEQIKLILDRNFDEIISKHHSKAAVDKFKSNNSLESLLSQLNWKIIYAAEEKGKIIGTGAFANFGSVDMPKYSVSNLYVLPEWHYKGVGRILFNKLLEEAKARNADRLYVPSSKNAVGFYEKMGFSVDCGQKREKDDEIIWMTQRVFS